MATLRLSMIAAMSENRVIGRGNALPWHISTDLKNFRRLTLGKPVIMGRKTFESIGKPLPGRPNLVMTRDVAFRPAGVTVCYDLEGALDAASAAAKDCGADEAMVIGGAEVYAALLPQADRLYLTEVHARIEGDAFFPALDPADWREASREPQDPESADGPRFSFVLLEKAGQRSQSGDGPWKKCVSESFEAAQEELIADRIGRRRVKNGQNS